MFPTQLPEAAHQADHAFTCLQQSMLRMCIHGINTSTLHVDGRTFHDSLEALTQCSAQDGRSSPRSMLAMSCQLWVCWRAGPRTRLRRTCQQARQTNFTSIHARKFLFPRKPSALAAVQYYSSAKTTVAGHQTRRMNGCSEASADAGFPA